MLQTLHWYARRVSFAKKGLRFSTTVKGPVLGNDEVGLNKYSKTITEPPSQGASQAMLHATGLNATQLKLPQVWNGRQTE